MLPTKKSADQRLAHTTVESNSTFTENLERGFRDFVREHEPPFSFNLINNNNNNKNTNVRKRPITSTAITGGSNIMLSRDYYCNRSKRRQSLGGSPNSGGLIGRLDFDRLSAAGDQEEDPKEGNYSEKDANERDTADSSATWAKFPRTHGGRVQQIFQRDKAVMRLISARSRATRAENELSSVKKQLEEEVIGRQKMDYLYKKLKEETDKKKLDRKTLVDEQLNRSIEKHDSAVAANESLLEKCEQYQSQITELSSQLALVRNEANEKEHELQSRINELTENCNMEKRKRAFAESENDQTGRDSEIIRAKNEALNEQLQTAVSDVHEALRLKQSAERKLHNYESENLEALGRGQQLQQLKMLKQSNDTLTRQNQQLKSQTENTLLLKEKLRTMTESAGRLEARNTELLVENNEIKSAISRAIPNQASSLASVDTLASQLVIYAQQYFDMKTALEQSESACSDFDTKIQEIQENYQTKLEKQEERLNSAFRKLNQLDELVKDEQRLKAKNDCISAELDGLRQQLMEKEQLVRTLNEKLSNMSSNTLIAKTASECQVSASLLTDDKWNDANERIIELEKLLAERDDKMVEMKSEQCISEDVQQQTAPQQQQLDFNPETTKVLHMAINPVDMAHTEHKFRMEEIVNENEKLRTRLAEFEAHRLETKGKSSSEDFDVTGQVDIRLEEIKRDKRLQELKTKIDTLEKQKQRAKEVQTALGRRYREMCTLLTGYQFKMREETLYQVESIYDPRKFFLFTKTEDGDLQLLDTEYAQKWLDFIESYLTEDRCIPAFLSAVTLQLYNNRDNGQNRTALEPSSSSGDRS